MALDLKQLEAEIIEQYLEDDNNRPWIIGFSGGKDSRMLLQTVWIALKKVVKELRKRDVYVVCNDTLVENPKIVQFNKKVLAQIQESAVKQSLPLTVVETIPKIEETFWVNLIGKGYPAPNKIFRWCTERLKINPTTRFILEKVQERGEAIILLGTRSDESSRRAQSIKDNEITGKRLRKHLLPNAWVYAPIKSVTIDELWQYMLQVPCPWGSDNRELITLYKNASGGDCPLVIDKTTPSCGQSRFGCWVCTVVDRDKSMEGLIENGEEWMEPLLDLRDLLAKSRESNLYRYETRRDGTRKEGTLGPYREVFRAEFLEKLLVAQKEIQAEQGEDISFITYQELIAIQVLWFRDHFFEPTVSDIYNKVYGYELDLGDINQSVIKEKELLKDVCHDEPEYFNLINDLLTLQKTKVLLMKNRGLQKDLEERILKHKKSGF